jgi:hypothetical protein
MIFGNKIESSFILKAHGLKSYKLVESVKIYPKPLSVYSKTEASCSIMGFLF